MTRRILVVDDEPLIREHVKMLLEIDGHEVEAAEDGASALQALRSGPYSLLITDLHLPDLHGREILAAIRAEGIGVGVIVLTGNDDTDVALEAMRAGADDFVTKPFEPDHLRHLVRRILDRRGLIDELEALRRKMREDYSFHNMVSKSPKMRRVFDLIEQVGPLGSTVLIQGETGTGKELVAHALHTAHPTRARGPWVAFNCAALNDSLLESELFGHEKGAFTGAERKKLGKFEQADGGTLFLDEVGDISHAMQSKLLRVLQSGTFERVGGTVTKAVDCRILAATNKPLDALVKAGRFRQDLFYRLNVIKVDLPPLRERPEDVPLLVEHFLGKFRAMSNPPVSEIGHEAMQAMIDYPWPGNIRELENAVKAAVAMADGPIIHREALPSAIAPRSRGAKGGTLIDVERPLPEITEDLVGRVERAYFEQLLDRYKGNVARCAKHSGLSRRSVAQKLSKYQLDRSSYRKGVGDAMG